MEGRNEIFFYFYIEKEFQKRFVRILENLWEIEEVRNEIFFYFFKIL